MNNLTEAEIKRLKETKNESQWNSVCDDIKAARNGEYPDDWFAVVMIGGLMSEVDAGWN
mgnify:CR=1 FL=1|tara:strand:- start:22 stop:198 length:177 start_codon:yes stop_codon:yes gene_type:complete